MLAYFMVHVWLGLVSTTAYAHRMVSHRATQNQPTRPPLLDTLDKRLLSKVPSRNGRVAIVLIMQSMGTVNMRKIPILQFGLNTNGRTSCGPIASATVFIIPSSNTDYEQRIKGVLNQYNFVSMQHRWYLFFF